MTANDADARLTITELSQQTGVPAVTLRAWERRYGLLRPERSHKGHRLYPVSEVARITTILGWLERGVSVGQVKPLLQGAREASELPDSSSHWQGFVQRALQLADQGQLEKLRQFWRDLLTQYPATTLQQQCWWPLRQQWQREGDSLDNSLRAALLGQSLAEQLHYSLQLGARNVRGRALLIQHERGDRLDSLWLALQVQQLGRPVWLQEQSLAALALIALVERAELAAVMLWADGNGDPAWRRQLESCQRGLRVPLFLLGSAAARPTVAGVIAQAEPGSRWLQQQLAQLEGEQ